MSAPPALWYEWTGLAMAPLHRAAAERAFVVGERYRLDHVEERSAATHAHFFASLSDAHSNLPDDLAERFPTPDALRKYALIRTGYRDERTFIASSKAEARRIAAFIKPTDEFAVVSVHDAAVVVWTAKSQSMKAMGKKAFSESKNAVLGFVAELLGVSPDQLGKAA